MPIHPIAPGTKITSGFRTKSRPDHDGTDYRAATGTLVKAAQDGVVNWRDNSRAGTNIEITGEGVTTGYSHLSKRLVKDGSKVKAGDVIAESGATGNVTGPHLHFYVLDGGKFLNPVKWLATSTPASKPSSSTLMSGSKGKQVGALQRGLRKAFPAYRYHVDVKRGQLIAVDDIFGPQTDAWVEEFQRRTGLVVDRVVGPKTIAKLAKYGVKL